MEFSSKRKLKFLSAALVASFVVGAMPWQELSADERTHGEYDAYPFEITYEQNSTWGYSTQGQYTITNISEYEVTSWSLEIDYYGDVRISNIWNASDITDCEADENITVTSNSAIAAGSTYTFGLIADGTDAAPVAPSDVNVIQFVSDEPEATPAPEATEPSADVTPTEEPTETADITSTPEPTQVPAEEDEETVIFSYAIFAASTTEDFVFQGWKSNITGDIYSGRNFSYQGSELHMDGYARTVGTVQPAGWITDMTGAEEGVTPLTIPDWKERHCNGYPCIRCFRLRDRKNRRYR